MTKIGIIGPNSKICSNALYDFGVQLGRQIAAKNRTIVCGGLGGFMEAVCKGTKQSTDAFSGQTVGILPGEKASTANPYIDIAIPTGIGIARNIIIVRTADIIIAAGGGATQFDGWAKEIAGRNLDKRQSGLLIPVNSLEDILKQLDNA